MKLVAITGSIGCGKTTLARQVKSLGYVVYDVDGWVRRLYNKKAFVKVVAGQFPEVAEAGGINKKKLRKIVFDNNEKLKKLENLIHPFLKQMLKEVIRNNCQRDVLVFLDVALLFEMKWDCYCDYVIVADAAYELQKKRVMERDHITADDFEKINSVQMNNSAKKLLADFVVDTDKPVNVLRAAAACIADRTKYVKRNCF